MSPLDDERPRDEDAAWREIVENFGDVPDVEEADRRWSEDNRRSGDQDRWSSDQDRWSSPSRPEEPAPVPWEDEGRFVPPVPPPVPRPPLPRYVAWLGLFGAPTLLLVVVVLGWSLPGLVTLLLGAWFVGGFVYLVSQMPPGPRDPGDNGARL